MKNLSTSRCSATNSASIFSCSNYYGLFLTLLFLVVGMDVAWGQSIFDNPITGTNPNTSNPYTTGQNVNANITVSGIGRGSGISGANANNRYNASGWSTGAIDLNDYFEFTINPNSGYSINFISFVYTSQVSSGTPSHAFRSSLDGFSANIGTPTTTGATIPLSGTNYQGITGPITFRFYSYGLAAGATTFSINDFTFNGTVSSASSPTIIVTPASLTNFTYVVGTGPSEAQTFSVSGTNLNGSNVTITAPTNFQVSSSEDGSYGSIVTLLSFNGTPTGIWVRLASGLSAGTYSGNVSVAGGGANTVNVSVSGEVVAPDVSLPVTFDLTSGDFSFTNWPSTSSAGAYPSNMIFHYVSSNQTNPFYNEGSYNYNCAYNKTSRPRVNGLDANGISFVTTSSSQYNNCVDGSASSRFTGAAILGINTSGRKLIQVTWIGGTIVVSDDNRNMTLRLQYRIGNSGDYSDVPGPIEYTSSTVGDFSTIGPVTLPTACQNQSEVYLRWIFYESSGTGGSRPELRLDNITVSSSDITLPLNFEYISAKAINKKAVVEWSTLNEVNTASMEIEHNNGASLQWKSIGKVEAAGFSSGKTEYSFTHETPLKGDNFYRIKQIDNDGTYSYSEVVSAHFGNTNTGLILTPNLVHSSLKISFEAPVENGRVLIYNLDGKLVQSYLLAEGIDVLRVDVSDLVSGHYVIQYQSNQGSETVRFVKE